MNYFSIHNHTDASNLRLLDAINRVEDLMDYAYEIGLSGLCLTEHESLSSHIRALQYYEKKCKQDERWKNFKLGLGNEIYLCRNDLEKDNIMKLIPINYTDNKTLIECKNLTKKFDEKIIFENISFKLNSNQRLAIVGDNGSGKSCLLIF